jgi:uncharacterized protein
VVLPRVFGRVQSGAFKVVIERKGYWVPLENVLTGSIFPVKMPYMLTRLLNPPRGSIFLFGPRGTGKSTWIQHHFAHATLYDLLDTSEVIRFSRQPSLLYQELSSLKKESWVVIDEVQKVPSLLNEVHRLIERHKLKFILSGSSARKLKKESSNMLARRARHSQLFPFVSAELKFRFHLEESFQFGMLPLAVTGDDKQGYLRTYADTYLREEIQAEALTRNIGNFARFLEVAARQNGQIVNVASISRDAEVARQTVQGYFDILRDTLIGDWLHPWKLKRSTKQVAHPKFYLFDSGVARAFTNRLPYPPTQEELGFLIETFLLSELKAYLAYSNLHYPIYFWRSHSNVEVDFFLETQKGFVAIECKSSRKWTNQFSRGLKRMNEELGQKKSIKKIGVYTGQRKAKWEDIEVFPVMQFLKALWNGEIIK